MGSQKLVHTQQQTQLQTQIQTLSPQQVMTVRLLEMPLEALQQRVEIECMENPWLEKSQEPTGGDADVENGKTDDYTADERASDVDDGAFDYRSEDDIPDYMLRTNNGSRTPENIEYGDTLSLYDQLKNQIGEYDLTPHEQTVLEYLIGSLDEDGLLKKPLVQMADEMEIYQGVSTSEAELERLLHVLWQFEPVGIGARSLQECLLIQIRRDKSNPLAKVMESVMERCYDDFLHKRWARIQNRLELSDRQLREVQREIMRLNPRPGSSLGESQSGAIQSITPDFIVETDAEGQIVMTLNQGNVPPLVVSADALEKLDATSAERNVTLGRADMEDIRFTRQYVERGQMFINALRQRRETMMRVMQTIIRIQRAFFLDGDEALLQAMKLEDVANLSGYDISTVSRVCNGKYVQTAFGTLPLKWFFSHGAIQNAENDAVSQRKVMAELRELIEQEDKSCPLSDEKLTNLMNQKGYQIARRTIAKYRELMGIPVARMRR